MQTITADFPAYLIVSGARRVDIEQEDALGLVWRDDQQDQVNELVSWRWAIVRPTPLRTSLVYSKVN